MIQILFGQILNMRKGKMSIDVFCSISLTYNANKYVTIDDINVGKLRNHMKHEYGRQRDS